MTDNAAASDSTDDMPRKSHLRWLAGWSIVGAMAFLRMFMDYYLPVGNGIDVSKQLIGHDFVNNWTGAHMALAQNAAKIFSITPYMDEMHRILWKDEPMHAFSYPPHILPLILILGFLPYFPALAAWTVSGMAAFQAAVLPHIKSTAGKIEIALLLLTGPAAIVNYILGQNGFFTAALFLAGLFLSERNPKTAGLLIGFLTVKPQLGLLLPLVLLLRRNWTCFASAAVTTVALAAISICAWGLQPWENFVHVTIPLQVSLIMAHRGFYIYMMPAIYTGVLSFDDPTMAMRGFWLLLHLAGAAWATFIGLRAVRQDGINETTVFMLAVATMLVPLYCFNYDMSLIAGALIIYVFKRNFVSTVGCLLLGFTWILPTAIIPMKVAGLLPLPGMILIGTLAYLDAQRRKEKRSVKNGGCAQRADSGCGG